MTRSRNAALDGVRALAVTAVLLFHGGVSWVQGGFLGVDLFFVLSGFLITGLLLSEHYRSGRVSLQAFWARRARRLLPGLLVMVVAVVTTVAYRTADGLSARLRGDALATLGHFANWRLAAQGDDYFALQADPSPLDHTWSLAIEAQFYLVWPLLVIGALALARGRRWLLMGIIVLSTGASVAATALAVHDGTEPTALYYRTDTRAPALLVGALLAVLVAHRPVNARPSRLASASLGLLGLLGLAGCLVLWHEASGSSTWLYQGGLVAAALASVALVAAAALDPDGLLGRVLGCPPLRGLGQISYGVYLWHWPVDIALTPERTGLHGTALLAARLILTLQLAGLSWLLIEQPVRRVVRLSFVLVPTALAASLTATVVFAYVTVLPVQPRLTTGVALASVDSPSTPRPSAPPAATPTPVRTPAKPAPRPRLRRTAAPVATRPVPQVTHTPARPAVPVDVLGDSVADSLGRGLQPVDTTYGAQVTNRGVVGCGIAATPRYRLRGQVYGVAEECRNWEYHWATSVAGDHPKVVLVVVGRHEVWDAELNGRWTNVGQADFDKYLADQLDQAISLASEGGARVAMATTPYFRGSARPDGGQWPENDPKRVDRFNVLLRQAVARHPGKAFVVDLNRKTCPDGHYTSTVDGVKIRNDGVHFSAAGARYLAPWLIP
ncbi:MAG TPA: acyltransferase family protein, partial [Nonomuraea sp.]|nr:acyltransferase family protein [Nonomuraea sp.]